MGRSKKHISKFAAFAVIALSLLISSQSLNVQAKTAFYSNNQQAQSDLSKSEVQSPIISNVSPNNSNNLETVTITISGQNLSDIVKVTLGSIILPDLTIVSSEALTATVPENIPAGVYTLTVTDSSDASASLENGYTIKSSGDGHSSNENKGYIYIIGGRSDYYTELENVLYTKINTDGTLNSWRTTSPMTMSRANLSSVIVGNYIYAIGGSENNTVEMALINSDGSLGTWTLTESMNESRTGLASVATSDYIYVIGGDGTVTVERSKIYPDGSLGEWEYTSSLNIRRGYHAAVIVGNLIYAIGGYGIGYSYSPHLNSVEHCKIKQDGSLGLWDFENSLQANRSAVTSVSAGGHIYVMGGRKESGEIQRSVEINIVNSEGSLSSWENVFSMIKPKHHQTSVYHDHSIYTIGGLGGLDGNNILNDVEYTRITDGLIPMESGLSINNGDLFTNDVNVNLTIGADPDARSIQVSNDGGFSGAAWETYTRTKSWQITSYGSYVIPRVVYVRYKDADGNVSTASSDDIILDVNAPTGSVQASKESSSSQINQPIFELDHTRKSIQKIIQDLSNALFLPLVIRTHTLPPGPRISVSLAIQAQDDVSGVADMIISFESAFKYGQWETYATSKTLEVPEDSTTIYVKFRDNAGNVSEVYEDTIQ